MGQSTATKTLKEANRKHTTQRDRRVRSFMHRMTRWARSLERDLLGTITANRGGTDAVRNDTDVILASALPEASVLMRRGLADLAMWSWDDEAAKFVRAIPIPFWLRRVMPIHTLLSTEGQPGDDGAALLEFQPDASFDIDGAFRKILAGELTKAETLDVIRELEFGSPTPEQLDAILTDAAWPDGLNAMERIVTVPRPEIAGLRSKIHEYLALPGPDRASAFTSLANDIGDLVGNVNFKAVRIARTEGTRVAEDMLRESWKEADEFIEGIQVFTANDGNVRPTHVKNPNWRIPRHGKIYRKQPGGLFRADDGEPLPRFPEDPNCRCWDTPVMIPEIEKELANVTVGPEYRAALDRFERERV
jgi:hypothetical protein